MKPNSISLSTIFPQFQTKHQQLFTSRWHVKSTILYNVKVATEGSGHKNLISQQLPLPPFPSGKAPFSVGCKVDMATVIILSTTMRSHILCSECSPWGRLPNDRGISSLTALCYYKIPRAYLSAEDVIGSWSKLNVTDCLHWGHCKWWSNWCSTKANSAVSFLTKFSETEN